MTSLNIRRANQSLDPGNRVELYTLDLRPLGVVGEGSLLYFSPSSIGETEIVYRKKKYVSVPIEATGFEVSGRGALPQPVLRIANINNLAGSLAATYEDLVGAILTREVTFRQFLDDGITPDPDATHPPAVFEIAQKMKQNRLYMEWKCTSFLDREGDMLPKRRAWKRVCGWQMRGWSEVTGDWDYSQATCPYAGGAMFDAELQPTTDPTKAACPKTVAGCRKHFGENAKLPFGGFIGLGLRG